jgi:hypothetical protein
MKINLYSFFMAMFLASSTIYSNQLVQNDIFYEIAQGNKKAVKAWLKIKPDLSIKNEQGRSVLTVAVLCSDHKIAKMLVKAGVAINAIDASGKTALDHAVENGSVKVVYDLIKKDGKVTTADNLYRLKSIIKDRSHSLLMRFAVLFFVGGVLFIPLAICAFALCVGPMVMIGSELCLTTVFCLMTIGSLVYSAYFWSLPFRALSWNRASQKNWMFPSRNSVSLSL